MKKLLFTCCILLAPCITTYAIRPHADSSNTAERFAERNYDIKYLKFCLNVSDTSTYISGNVSTTAMVTAESLSSYVFELNAAMIIDSAQVNGVWLPVSGNGLMRTILLPYALARGKQLTAQIFYHGTPPEGSGFFNGLTHSVSSGGTHMVYSVSDPYVASDWWPAKQDINDKIDSVDMYITVPAGVADGSNGVLLHTDTTSAPGYTTWHWQTHYPIDYYLISIAVARYAVYSSYMHFTGSSDSMLIQNFLLDTATFNPKYKANFDSIGMIVDYYSTLFGRYPFWKEKYGVCFTTLPGGMEHQTMTTIGTPSTDVIAHELCHQWFGDHVTYATWGDVWLSEGFATFAEELFLNHFHGAAAAFARRQYYLRLATSARCGEIFVTDTTSADALFNPVTVYAKASGVVNMLRYLAPEDSLFFTVLKTYQAIYGFRNASTADMKKVAESVYGFKLDTFFDEWIYGKGYPEYQVSWNQVGSTVYVKLIQTTSCPSATPLFSGIAELKLSSAAADTTIKVYNNAHTTLYSFTWEPTVTSLDLNPDVWTICEQTASVIHDSSLGPGLPAGVEIHFNKAENCWEIAALPEGSNVRLTDMGGETVWQEKSTLNKTIIIPASQFAKGDYLLKISNDTGAQSIPLSYR